jgi:hypothetical protein
MGKRLNLRRLIEFHSLIMDLDRTAAVHFADGSSVAIAKVEGSRAYKAFIRQDSIPATQPTTSHLERLYSIPSYFQGFNTRLWKHPQTVWGFNSEPIKPMLQALKAAVESYLGNSICFVNYSFPKVNKHSDYQIQSINKAINQVGLTNVWNYTFNPATSALYGNGFSKFSQPTKLILVVDNSHYGFNLQLLFRDDDAINNDIRHDYRLLNKSQSLERSIILQRAIEDIIRPPFRTLPLTGDLPSHIDELVLYGDDVWDPDFSKTLTLVLDAELVSRARKYQPIFSAAFGLAYFTFDQINDPMSSRNANAQFLCCWKSMGKGCPVKWEYQASIY